METEIFSTYDVAMEALNIKEGLGKAVKAVCDFVMGIIRWIGNAASAIGRLISGTKEGCTLTEKEHAYLKEILVIINEARRVLLEVANFNDPKKNFEAYENEYFGSISKKLNEAQQRVGKTQEGNADENGNRSMYGKDKDVKKNLRGRVNVAADLNKLMKDLRAHEAELKKVVTGIQNEAQRVDPEDREKNDFFRRKLKCFNAGFRVYANCAKEVRYIITNAKNAYANNVDTH